MEGVLYERICSFVQLPLDSTLTLATSYADRWCRCYCRRVRELIVCILWRVTSVVMFLDEEGRSICGWGEGGFNWGGSLERDGEGGFRWGWLGSVYIAYKKLVFLVGCVRG